MILRNLIISIRNLRKNKIFASLGIIGFTIGFTTCLLIGLYVYNELTMDQHVANYKYIYRIFNSKQNSSDLDYKLFDSLLEKYPAIEQTCPVEIQSPVKENVSINNEIIEVSGIISTTNNFFNFFSVGVKDRLGNKPFLDRNSSVITASTAEKFFGDVNPLGKRLKVNKLETIITAVIDDFPVNSSLNAQILLNSDNEKFRLKGFWVNGETWYVADFYVRLNDKITVSELEANINTSNVEYDDKTEEVMLQPLKSIYLDTSVTDSNRHGNKSLLMILASIGVIILILSVINYINYVLSLQLKKLREFGIKKANGASFKNLLIYYLSDSFVWISIAFILSFVVLAISLQFFNQLFGEQLYLKMFYFSPLILFSLGILLFVICISSIPFFVLFSRSDIQSLIRNSSNHTDGKRLNLGILSILQLSVSVFLVIGLLVVQRQVFYAKNKDLGFNHETLMYVEIPYRSVNPTSFKDEVLKHSSIVSASLSESVPGKMNFRSGNTKSEVDISEVNKTVTFGMRTDSSFLSTMGMKLLAGRQLSPTNKMECMVNETYLKANNLEFSENLKLGKKMAVVGVVKDFHFASLYHAVQPVVFSRSNIGKYLSVRIGGGEVAVAMDHIRKTWKNMAPEMAIKYTFYDNWLDSLHKKEQQLGFACSVFSVVAIIITCLGLLGQIIFSSIARTKEIGIRKVNGAKVSEILSMLNKDFIKRIAIAFVVACPIAYYAMNKWLENFAYKTSLSWWIFALAGVLALGIALLTVSWQSWRAATRNPVEALRYE